MTPHARRIQPAARPEAREPVARRITPDSRPTDIRRLVAALLSAVIPGLGQAVNGRFRLARWLLIPAVVLVPLVDHRHPAVLAGAPRGLGDQPGRAADAARAERDRARLAADRRGAGLLRRALPGGPRPARVRGPRGRDAPRDGARTRMRGRWVRRRTRRSPACSRGARSATAGRPAARCPGSGERINILLVGVDATPKRSATLTDTMMVISLDPVGKTASMVSIPRDMVFVPLGNGDDYGPKINSLLGYAERNPEQFPNGPMRTLQDAIGALLGIPIHYYARIDFEGFINMVDCRRRRRHQGQEGHRGPVVRRLRDRRARLVDHEGPPPPRRRQRPRLRPVRKAAGESDFTRAARQQEILVAMRSGSRAGRRSCSTSRTC